jgi:hypothetical protein
MQILPVIVAIPHLSLALIPVAKAAAGSALAGFQSATAPSGAGDSLIQGFRDAARKAFLMGLNLAQTEGDREAAARAYLRATGDVKPADLQNDPLIAPLQSLAKSIIARTNHHGPAFVSIFG